MAPPLTKKQEEALKELYYKDKFFLGRDKVFQELYVNQPELNISRRQVQDWLSKQEVYQRNLRPPIRRDTKPIETRKPGYIQIDLIDMSSSPSEHKGLSSNSNSGYKWILTSIDTFTRKVGAEALRYKNSKWVSSGLKKILDGYNHVSVVQSDNGTEFLNPMFQKVLEDRNIKHLTSKPYTPTSQGYIERFNGTLKSMINKLMTASSDNNWKDDLPILIENYNDSIHDITKKAPNEVEKNDEEVKKRLDKKKNKNPNKIKDDLVIGDSVRVVLKKSALDKKGTNTYSKEIYTIVRVSKSKKPFNLNQYKLEDEDGDLIKGVYNITELQKIG